MNTPKETQDQDQDFKEYKHYILDNIDNFKTFKDHHNNEFLFLRNDINGLKKELIHEIKDLMIVTSRIDSRLSKVEVKSGIWGVIGGVMPFLIWYFTKGGQ